MDKVRKILDERFIGWDKAPSKAKNCRMARIECYNPIAIRFDDGRFTIVGIHSLAGVVAGYNSHAVDAAVAAKALGYISNTELEAFFYWYRHEDKKQQAASELERAERTAEQQGYKLVKK